MESEDTNNLFKQREKQVEAMASPIDFGLGEERWQHPELGAKWMNYLKGTQKEITDKPQFQKQVSELYNRDVIEELISKNPNNDFEIDLFTDEEDPETAIIKYFDLKKSSEITPELKRKYIAHRISGNRFNQDLTGAYATAFGLADNKYNKKEVDPFAYVPQFQQTTPSRASILNTGQQQIDTSLPAFLQVRNPFHNKQSEAYNPLITKFHTEERLNPYAASNPEIFQRRVDALNQLNYDMYPLEDKNDELSRMRFAKRVREETQANLMKRWKEGYFTYPNER
jgi:hypothetical protein